MISEAINMRKYIRTKAVFKGEPAQLEPITLELKPVGSIEEISFEKILPLDGQTPEEVWGTPGDCEETDMILYRNSTILEYSFDTEDAIPLPVYERLAEMYPDLQLQLKYASEDYGENCGIYNSPAGSSVLTFEESDDPFLLACEIWDVDPDEEMAERSVNYYEE